MSNELKVLDAPHLVRRSNSPGVVINTNYEGFQAAKQARQKAQDVEDMKEEIELLRQLVRDLNRKFEGS